MPSVMLLNYEITTFVLLFYALFNHALSVSDRGFSDTDTPDTLILTVASSYTYRSI